MQIDVPRSTRIILVATAAILIAAASASAKLQSRLRGTIVPEETRAKVGQTVPIAVTITTTRPFSLVEVAIKLPAGVALVEGKPSEEIVDFKPGEKRTFRYRVRVIASGEQVVMVTARAKNLGPDEGWGNTFVTVINPGPAATAPLPPHGASASYSRISCTGSG